MSVETEALGAVSDLGNTFGEVKFPQIGNVPHHLLDQLGMAFRNVNSIEPVGIVTELGIEGQTR